MEVKVEELHNMAVKGIPGRWKVVIFVSTTMVCYVLSTTSALFSRLWKTETNGSLWHLTLALCPTCRYNFMKVYWLNVEKVKEEMID